MRFQLKTVGVSFVFADRSKKSKMYGFDFRKCNKFIDWVLRKDIPNSI